MDLIIHKLLDDALTLLSDFWQALWNGSPPSNRVEPHAAGIKHDPSGTIHPLV